MVLTVNFRDSVKARIEADPEYRAALFKEAVQTLIEGDVGTARAVCATLSMRPSALRRSPKRRAYHRRA